MKNLVFDLGNVLVELDFSRTLEAFRQIGISDIEEWMHREAFTSIVQDTELNPVSPGEVCRRIRTATHCAASDDQIIAAWDAMLTDISDERKQKLLDLRCGHRIFLLSNTNLLHWHYCADRFFTYRQWGVDDYFEQVFLSYEMHLAKPSEEIFAETLRRAGLRAEDTLFIDDLADNCAAARRLGIHTYQNQHINDWLHEDHLFE